MEIVVVTKVPDPKEDGIGNMALAGLDLHWVTEEKDSHGLDVVVPFTDFLGEMLGDPKKAFGFVFNLREPVFALGEVLILNDYGREIGYPGRKPNKWSIEVTAVETLEEAEALADRAMYPEKYEQEDAIESIKKAGETP